MKFILLSLLLLSHNLFAQDSCKLTKDGFAMFAGIGSTFGGGGLKAEYLKSIKKKTYIISYIGIGTESISTNAPGRYLGYCIGVNMEYGKQFRLIIGFAYGSNGVAYDTEPSNPENAIYNIHARLGPSGIIGYKFTGVYGIVYECFIGMSYVKNPISTNINYFFWPMGGTGIGYKF